MWFNELVKNGIHRFRGGGCPNNAYKVMIFTKTKFLDINKLK